MRPWNALVLVLSAPGLSGCAVLGNDRPTGTLTVERDAPGGWNRESLQRKLNENGPFSVVVQIDVPKEPTTKQERAMWLTRIQDCRNAIRANAGPSFAKGYNPSPFSTNFQFFASEADVWGVLDVPCISKLFVGSAEDIERVIVH